MPNNGSLHARCRHPVIALVAVAILIAGCSSSGGNHASPTATIATTSSTSTTTTTASPSRVVAKLGPCPSTYPTESLKALNAGVSGLDKTLVPIFASAVHICEYVRPLRYDPRQPLEIFASGLLTSAAATTFERETNRGARYVDPPECRQTAMTGPVFVLMFATDAQQGDLNTEETMWCRRVQWALHRRTHIELAQRTQHICHEALKESVTP
jgi:hypothetical protein